MHNFSPQKPSTLSQELPQIFIPENSVKEHSGKPELSQRHFKQRLDFAVKFRKWTIDDWKKVIWSDETKVCRYVSNGRVWGWKRKGYPMNSNQVKRTMNFGGENLMMLGCMTFIGVGYFCRIDGVMNS